MFTSESHTEPQLQSEEKVPVHMAHHSPGSPPSHSAGIASFGRDFPRWGMSYLA